MDIPEKASDRPIEVELKEGRTYSWCACGLSDNQPYCDGKHIVTDIKPKLFRAEKTGNHLLCMCKATKNSPYCDNSHKS